MAVSTQTYTTSARVTTRVSSLGVSLRVDHDAVNAMNEAIESAASEVEWYCWQYDPAALALSRWVATKATDLAIYYLCTLRLNEVPGVVQELYDHAVEQLQLVQKGQVMIPGIAQGRGSAPTVTNYRVDMTRYPSVRVERPRTTGAPVEGGTHPRRIDPTADAIDGG